MTIPVMDNYSLSLTLPLLIGEGFFDTITLGSMVVPHQFITVANEVLGFSGLDGVLGCVESLVCCNVEC